MHAIYSRPSVSIRNVQPNNLVTMQQITAYYIAHTAINLNTEPTEIQELEQLIHECHNAQFPCIGLFEKDVLKGYAYLVKFRAKPGYRHSCELSIYLDPNATGKGYGSKLLQELLDQARQNNTIHQIISYITANQDTGSVRLHENFGFKRCGYLTKVGYKFDQFHDIMLMQLSL